MKTETIKLWETPSHYFGAEFPEYYTVISKTRDSGCYGRANFDAMLKLLGGETKHSEAVIVARFSHWLCGWVETILVHKSATKKVKIADETMTRMEDYPVINESLWSEYESEEKHSIWVSMDLRERIKLCVEAGLSCFAARCEYIPGDVDMYIEVN